MEWFLYIIGFFWIASGCVFILYTSECRNMLRKILMKVNEKYLSALIIVVGIFLLFSASYSQNFWFIIFLGILAIAKGLLFLFNPNKYYEKLRNWYLDTASDQTYRFFGILVLIIGTAVVSWV